MAIPGDLHSFLGLDGLRRDHFQYIQLHFGALEAEDIPHPELEVVLT